MTSPTGPQPPTPPEPVSTRVRARRGWIRRLSRWLLVLALLGAGLLGGAYYALTQTDLVGWVLSREVRARTGAELTTRHARFHRTGALVVEGAALRHPSLAGDGGQVLSAERLEIRADWASLLGPNPRVTSVLVDRPRVRLSQATEDGGLNLDGLRLTSPGAAGAMPQASPPSVLIREGVIEIGEHSKQSGRFESLRTIEVAGSVQRSRDADGSSVIRLARMVPGSPTPDFEIRGKYSKEGLSLELDGLGLSDWPVESVPTPLREVYRNLALEGRIGKTRFDYGPDGKIRASLELLGVALNLPVTPQPEEDASGNPIPLPPHQLGRQLRMEGVSGTLSLDEGGIEGSFSGLVESLRYEVALRINGTSANAPARIELTARDFELTERPQILRFAPGIAQHRLAQFSNPTGIVDATVVITRGEPKGDEPGEVRVQGSVRMKDGTAAFERFPYRFEHMTGEWRFSDDELRIVDVRGIAPGGATIAVSGTIAPPTSSARVDIAVRVENLPVDEALERALGKRRAITDALFNRERMRELVALGLVADPPTRRAVRQRALALEQGFEEDYPGELVVLRAWLGRPEFELGGRASVDVRITRELGEGGEWDDTIRIHFPRAGILPEKFPYPMEARDITIEKVNTRASVDADDLRGVVSGSASVSARVDLDALERAGDDFAPEITLHARDIEVSPLLVHAIPEGSGGVSPRRVLQDLAAGGTIREASVRIGMVPSRITRERAGYDISLEVQGCSARPDPAGELLRDVEGTIRVTQDRVWMDLLGRLGAGDAPGEPASLRTDLSLGESPDAGSILAEIDLASHDLSRRVEPFVRVLAPEAARGLEDLRARYQPDGSADLRVEVRRLGDGPLTTSVLAEALDGSALVDGSRVRVEESRGTIRYLSSGEDAPGSLAFDDFACDLFSDGVEAGRLELSGAVRADASPEPGRGLDLTLSDASFDTAPVRLGLARVGGTPLELARRHLPRGTFDVELHLAHGPGNSWTTRGEITPRTLSISSDAGQTAFLGLGGKIELVPGGGRLRELWLATPDWELECEGSWIADAGTTSLEARFDVSAIGVPPDLLAILPPDVEQARSAISLEALGPTSVRSGSLSLTIPPDGPGSVRVQGRCELSDASMDVGVPIVRGECVADFLYERLDPGAPGRYDVKAILPSARVQGVTVTDGRVRIASGSAGETIIPLFAGDCHGGRVAGSALIVPGTTPEEPRRYTMEVRGSDLRLASVIEDARNAEIRALIDVDQSPDETRGRLDAEFSLAGTVGEPASKRGRGTATVGGQRIVDVPVVVALIRLSNLELPVREQLDYARLNFYLQGSRLNFEQIVLSSSSVQLIGFGTADLPQLGLDLRFRARNRLRIPVLSALLEGIRNELFTAAVRGTPGAPLVRIVTLGGARRLFQDAFGSPQDDQTRRLDRIEQEARRQRLDPDQIFDRAGGPISPAP